MNNITVVKDTPDFALKNITKDIELSENDFFKELDGSSQKEKAFDFLANKELNEMKAESTAFNASGQTQEKIQVGQVSNNSTKVNLGNMLDAELCTKLIDTLVPSLFVLILRMGVGVNVNKRELQATPKELEAIKPVVQKCLEAIELNISNPFIALGIVLGTIYTTKAADVGFNKFMDQKERKESRPLGDNAYDDAREKKPRKQRSDKGQRRI